MIKNFNWIHIPFFSFQKPFLFRPFANLFNLDEEKIDLEVNPEKCLFSSLVEYETPNEENAKLIKDDSKLVLNNNTSLVKDKTAAKSFDFQLSRKDYLSFVQNNPNGRVNIFNYKETKFTLVGAQYEFLPIKNVYQILNYSKPDVVLLQIKPDQLLDNFKILLKKEKNQKFSSSKYFSQCLRRPEEIMPSNEYRQKIAKTLENNKIYLEYNKEAFSEKNYKEYEILDRLSMDTIATACLYCEIHKIPMVLCDVPELVFRQNFVNSKTLMQIQNIFTKCCRELSLYPDYRPQSPMNMGYHLFPELFLEKSDKYISTVIEYLLSPKVGFKGKKILGLLGYGQSDSVAVYLNNRNVSHFDVELTSPEPQGNIIRDITGEEVLEKHAIMDVMQYGENILDYMDQARFDTSLKIIEKYADPMKINSEKIKEFRVLHYELLKKYQHFCSQEMEEGRVLLKREFLKKTRLI